MKKNLYIIISIVIFIALGLTIWQTKMPNNNVITNSAPLANIPQEMGVKEVTVIIDYSDGLSENFTVELRNTMTAFDVLKKISEEKNIALETKDYQDVGIFIEKIGRKKNRDDSKYWLYYINGKMPMVAADKKRMKAGDVIEFKFEKSPY